MAKLFHTLDIAVSYVDKVGHPLPPTPCCVLTLDLQFAQDQIDVCDLPELSEKEIEERLPALGPRKRLMK